MTLKVAYENDGQIQTLRLKGLVDEEADFSKLAVSPDSRKVIIDLAGLEAINSIGCRSWIKWLKTLNPDIQLSLVNCTPVFLDYVNMIDGFVPKNGVIESFEVPYYCETCDHTTLKKFVTGELKKGFSEIPDQIKCYSCQKDSEIDVIVSSFFKFLHKH